MGPRPGHGGVRRRPHGRVGNEAEGLLPETVATCDGAFRLDMAGFMESFNVSVCVGMALHHVLRRRRAALADEGRTGDLSDARRSSLLARWYVADVRGAAAVLRREAQGCQAPRMRSPAPTALITAVCLCALAACAPPTGGAAGQGRSLADARVRTNDAEIDARPAWDARIRDAEVTDAGCDPGTGDVLGQVCAPNGRVWLVGATDWDGEPRAGGAPQSVEARIRDDELRAFMQTDTITVDFPETREVRTAHWVVADAVGPGTKTLLEADVTLCLSARSCAPGEAQSAVPLLASYQPAGQGAGVVVFTSFHEEVNLNEGMERVLFFLVFML